MRRLAIAKSLVFSRASFFGGLPRPGGKASFFAAISWRLRLRHAHLKYVVQRHIEDIPSFPGPAPSLCFLSV
jgi:hypothetical protein